MAVLAVQAQTQQQRLADFFGNRPRGFLLFVARIGFQTAPAFRYFFTITGPSPTGGLASLLMRNWWNSGPSSRTFRYNTCLPAFNAKPFGLPPRKSWCQVQRNCFSASE